MADYQSKFTGEEIDELLQMVKDSSPIESGQCGENVYWNLYDNGVLYIYGEGATYNYETGLFEEDNRVTDVIIKDGVTSIGTALLRKSDLVNVVIPNSVTDIMGGAFIECRNLEKITIPNGVIRIHSSAFENCEKLSSVTIPDSITDIRSYAFNGCDSLTDVLYNGTKEQWDLITIIGHNEPLLNATLYCEYKEEIEINVPTITANGHYELTPPNENTTISKVTVEVAVPTQGGGGGGGGIIDVAELPTSGIDENAVYRVTTLVQTGELYIRLNGVVITANDFAQSMGASAVLYFVDELPTDFINSVSVLHIYVLKSNGIGYIKYAGSESTIGKLVNRLIGIPFEDKGYTSNIYGETTGGIFASPEVISTVYFIRENGEWLQITPEQQAKEIEIKQNGMYVVNPDDNKALSKITINVNTPNIGDLFDGSTKINITEEFFIKSDGQYIERLNSWIFSGFSLGNILIPNNVKTIAALIAENAYIDSITFKGTPNDISASAFNDAIGIYVINVPWSEGDAINANAPWGASYATINYNYTEG